VDELDRRGGGDELGATGRARAGGEDHEQRPQPLAAGRDRVTGVVGEHRAVPGGQRHEALLDLRQQRRHVAAGGADDAIDGRRGRRHRFVPTCRAMMPPAVRM
jgi:hypothetical protein